jgi:hypothetical protein
MNFERFNWASTKLTDRCFCTRLCVIRLKKTVSSKYHSVDTVPEARSSMAAMLPFVIHYLSEFMPRAELLSRMELSIWRTIICRIFSEVCMVDIWRLGEEVRGSMVLTGDSLSRQQRSFAHGENAVVVLSWSGRRRFRWRRALVVVGLVGLL